MYNNSAHARLDSHYYQVYGYDRHIKPPTHPLRCGKQCLIGWMALKKDRGEQHLKDR